MDVELAKPGSYIIAVSGGVDSMALLHTLHQKNQELDNQWKLIVAHLDHGIRPDSAEDRKLVERTAKEMGLPFAYEEAHLGAGASEETARKVRYDFLHKAQHDNTAVAIVTAHHQDDVLETTIINLLRGSGRKGLTSLANREDIERPLLHVSKQDIVAYANKQNLQWREDSTNQDTDYLRNYVRLNLLPHFDYASRQKLLDIINDLRETNEVIDGLLLRQLKIGDSANELDRSWFARLPYAVAMETMAAWLRDNGIRSFDSKTLERLVVAAKVAAPGKTFDVLRNKQLAVGAHSLALIGPER